MKQITLISGKGGTGKTSITAAFASLSTNAVFADCDVQTADLHLVLKPDIKESHDFFGIKKVKIIQDECIRCGLCFNLCHFDAIDRIRNKYYVRTFSCEGCDLCLKACPVSAIEQIDNRTGEFFISETRFGPLVYGQLEVGEEIMGKLISVVRGSARDIANERKKDYLIVDGPPGIGINAISSINGADMVLIITEPSQSALSDLKRSVNLSIKYKIPTAVIINKYDLNSDITSEIDLYCKNESLQIIAKIPYDRNIAHAMFEQKSVIEYAPDSETAIIITDAWKQLSVNY